MCKFKLMPSKRYFLYSTVMKLYTKIDDSHINNMSKTFPKIHVLTIYFNLEI